MKRLWLISAGLFGAGLYARAHGGASLAAAAAHMGVPAIVMALAAALLRRPAAERAEEAEARRVSARTGHVDDGVRVIARPRRPTVLRQWWRLVVLLSALVCYNWILWSDWLVKSRGGAFASNPQLQVVWQLVWLLLAVSAVVLNAALDFVHCVLASALLYASFLTASAVELRALWAQPSCAPGARGRPEGVCVAATHELAKGALCGLCGIALFLVGAHRINRFERHSFVQQYLLWGKVRAAQETPNPGRRCAHARHRTVAALVRPVPCAHRPRLCPPPPPPPSVPPPPPHPLRVPNDAQRLRRTRR